MLIPDGTSVLKPMAQLSSYVNYLSPPHWFRGWYSDVCEYSPEGEADYSFFERVKHLRSGSKFCRSFIEFKGYVQDNGEEKGDGPGGDGP